MATNIALKCPKCGKGFKQRAADTKSKDRFTCSSCGANFLLTEFKTAAGKSIGKHAIDVARDMFKKR